MGRCSKRGGKLSSGDFQRNGPSDGRSSRKPSCRNCFSFWIQSSFESSGRRLWRVRPVSFLRDASQFLPGSRESDSVYSNGHGCSHPPGAHPKTSRCNFGVAISGRSLSVLGHYSVRTDSGLQGALAFRILAFSFGGYTLPVPPFSGKEEWVWSTTSFRQIFENM